MRYIYKACYKTAKYRLKTCYYKQSPYLCNVFFIVLDLRLTKVGVQRYSFFYARKSDIPGKPLQSLQYRFIFHLHDADGIAATGSSFQFQDRFGRNDTFTDNISLRICLIIGIFCIGIDGCNILLVCIQEVQFQS